MNSYGQKVTTDSQSQDNPVYEGGLVTSDSLAAESKSNGGTFGANNPHTGVSKQPSNSTTSNITDTSAAERLDPAPDAGSRNDDSNVQDTLDKGHVDPFTHKIMEDGTKRSSNDGNLETSKSEDFSNRREQMPNLARGSGEEDDDNFYDSAPNASFNNDIGGPNDPGRLAEEAFVRRNNQNAADSGRARDENLDSEGQYDKLQEEPAPGTN
jgi:hypothetical protein